MSFSDQAAEIAATLELTPELSRLRSLAPNLDLSSDLLAAVLDEAAKFAERRMAPLSASLDRVGCHVAQDRVVLPPGQVELWRDFAEGGWMSLDIAETHGGQGLPLAVLGAAQELFDRACVAFGMISGGSRSAARLLEAHAPDDLKAAWLPQIAAGAWTATICISESEAGSDVGRIRTQAVQDQTGIWRVTGEKMWISFGDHQAAERIGHCLLARTPGAAEGTRGLSLFFVPSVIDTDQGPMRNGVETRGVEHKMGLHASPTCALGFEGARATLIGQEGRGLSLLFRMITAMRLSVGVQGLGVAAGALATAKAYAQERRQGGAPTSPAVPIIRHWDVRAALAEMEARVMTLRALVLAASSSADLADREIDAPARSQAGELLQWLLPIVKTSGAETAFEVSSQAMQVMGAAGYTKDWPVEQSLRDARVLAIYEGTSGIQAQDLLKRRLLANDSSYQAFLIQARADAAKADPEVRTLFDTALCRFIDAVAWLKDPARTSADLDCAASPFLALAILVAQGWAAVRLSKGCGPVGEDLARGARFYLRGLAPKIAWRAGEVELGASRFVPDLALV